MNSSFHQFDRCVRSFRVEEKRQIEIVCELS